MDSIQLKKKELLTYHCGCHGNLVTIATRYVDDVYCPIEPPYQIWTQYGLRQRSYKVKCILRLRLRLINSDSLTDSTHKIGNLNNFDYVKSSLCNLLHHSGDVMC